jgi:hypothetical protein
MVWPPDVGGICPHDSTWRRGCGGPKLPGEQLVVDAKPALLLRRVGALDRQEAFESLVGREHLVRFVDLWRKKERE